MLHRVKSNFALRILIAVAVTVFAVHMGTAALKKEKTDEFSEGQAVWDARMIFEGKHKYGIVEYAHFPNGPSYLLLPALKFGITDRDELRVVPVYFSAVCIGLLCFGLLSLGSLWISAPFAIGISGSLLYQPGVVNWMGALHEHGYALAICFAGMGLGLLSNVGWKTLFLISFISGWIGYDFTFCFLFSLVCSRWLLHARARESFATFVKKFTVDALVVGLGTFMAVATHVIQNALVMGGVKVAFADLFGSAAARAGLEVAHDLNPVYAGQMDAVKAGVNQLRIPLIKSLVAEFFTGKWVNTDLFIVQIKILAGLSLIVILLRALWLIKSGIEFKWLARVILLYLGALFFVPLAAVTWFVLMPEHARFHFHFIPRHFFAPCVLLAVIMCDLICRGLKFTSRDSRD